MWSVEPTGWDRERVAGVSSIVPECWAWSWSLGLFPTHGRDEAPVAAFPDGVPQGGVPALVEGAEGLRVDDCGPAALRTARNAVVGMLGAAPRWSLPETVRAEIDLLTQAMQPVVQPARVIGADETDSAHAAFERVAGREGQDVRVREVCCILSASLEAMRSLRIHDEDVESLALG